MIMETQDLISRGFTTFKIAKELGLPSFAVQKAAVQSRKYEADQLKKIYNSLIKCDFEQKTREKNISALLDIFIVLA